MTFARGSVVGTVAPAARSQAVAPTRVQHWLAVSRRGGAGRKTPALTGRTQSEGAAQQKSLGARDAEARGGNQLPDENSTLMYGSMVLTVETVTPVIAQRWLASNQSNRRLRLNKVAQYARDMVCRAWHPKPIAICFTPEGHLGNGQHTLSAIVASGTTQLCLISRNTPLPAIANMDRGIIRTIADLSKFIGVDMGGRAAAVARILAYGPTDSNGSSHRSFWELFEAYQFHQEVIDFALSIADKGKKAAGFSASSVAVMARAAYSKDRTTIARFAEIIKTGVANGPHESPAIRFRDFCVSLRGGVGSAARHEVYQKAQSSLDHFLRGVPMSKLYGTAVELFPIPTMEAK